MTETTIQDAFIDITVEHVSELSFLWLRRSQAIAGVNQEQRTIRKIERRMTKHIAGLLLTLNTSETLALEALQDFSGAGECFTVTTMALASGNVDVMHQILAFAQQNKRVQAGFISAFGWSDLAPVRYWLGQWLYSDDLYQQYVALAICSIRGIDPGPKLTEILKSRAHYKDDQLFSRALRLAAELNRQDLKIQITEIAKFAHKEENNAIAFWAFWSTTVLGSHGAAVHLKPWVINENQYQKKAMDITFRLLPNNTARDWIKTMAQSAPRRQTIIAISTLGDVQPVGWLIQQMQDLTLARIAGHAFSMITGLDLETQQLHLPEIPKEWADMVEAFEDADTIESSAELGFIAHDSYLPWPNATKIHRYWQQHQHDYATNQRYIMGSTITTAHLDTLIANGKQHQRRAAAFEKVLKHGGIFINTNARLTENNDE